MFKKNSPPTPSGLYFTFIMLFYGCLEEIQERGITSSSRWTRPCVYLHTGASASWESNGDPHWWLSHLAHKPGWKASSGTMTNSRGLWSHFLRVSMFRTSHWSLPIIVNSLYLELWLTLGAWMQIFFRPVDSKEKTVPGMEGVLKTM